MTPVGVHRRVREHIGLRVVADLLEIDAVVDLACRGEHLSAAAQAARDAFDRRVVHVRGVVRRNPSHAEQQHAERVQAALVHERAGHDRIVREVAGEIPVVGRDVGFAEDGAEPVATAHRIDLQDAIDELHASRGEAQRGRKRDAIEERAEASCGVAGAESRELAVGVAFLLHRDERRERRGAGAALGSRARGLGDDAASAGELLLTEEAGAAVVHGDEGLIADVAVEAEEKEPGVALADEAVDADVVADRFAGNGKVAMKDDLRVEQPVDAESFGLLVDAEPRREEEIRLARFDADADGGTAAVEVPRAGKDVVLGDHASGLEASRRAGDRHDAVDEHERLVGEAHASRVPIDRGELRTERLADLADGELQALLAIEERRRRGPLHPERGPPRRDFRPLHPERGPPRGPSRRAFVERRDHGLLREERLRLQRKRSRRELQEGLVRGTRRPRRLENASREHRLLEPRVGSHGVIQDSPWSKSPWSKSDGVTPGRVIPGRVLNNSRARHGHGSRGGAADHDGDHGLAPRRSVEADAALVAVERGEVDGHTGFGGRADREQQCAEAVGAALARRDRDVRAPREDLRDHPRARALRPHLEEHAHAVGVRFLDDLREVEAVHRVREDRIRGARLVGHVARRPRAAVEADPRGRRRRQPVQRVVRVGHLLHEREVDGRHAGERQRLATEGRDDALDVRALAADHALCRRVHDEERGGSRERGAHVGGRAVHDDHVPVGGVAPRFGRDVARPAELRAEERRRQRAREHAIAIGPSARREESR